MPHVLVTGATDGIGRETARELARRGARVIVHGRSAAKAREVSAELRQLAPAGAGSMPEPIIGDFASLEDVRKMADRLVSRGERIDVLINNAGVYLNEVQKTADGFEMTFGVNHLAPFLLTHLLLPVLREATGAATSVRLALDPEFADLTGRYFSNGIEAPMAAAAHDRELSRAFYELSCRLTGVTALSE